MNILGFDIGGTKCAVTFAECTGDKINIRHKKRCPTDHKISGEQMLKKLILMADEIIDAPIDKIGISCGGPLDSRKGIVISPPNLPTWKNVAVTDIITEHYSVEAKLQNDANACALAEWKFGAAKGYDNAVFLTFGTGLGAGLILNGRLYEGANGNAGEVGHIRLSNDGPMGYGKFGSFEGFCSGSGIAKLGISMAKKRIEEGIIPSYYKEANSESEISAKSIADAARRADEYAIEVYRVAGERLGVGLSIIIDILNPDIIVLGGIYPRSRDLLIDSMTAKLKEESLPFSLDCCKILPAKLGEEIGDFGAIATALY